MEVRYRRERNECFLILEEEEEGDAYVTRMLTENRIPGVLALSLKQMDQRNVYHYEISGRQSLQKLLEKRPVSAEEIRLLFYGLERSLAALEEYLLDINYVLLEPEFLYVSVDFSQVYVCCYPGKRGDFFGGLGRLSQYLLNKIDHMNKDSVELAYEIFRIASEEDFTFADIRRALAAKAGSLTLTEEAKEAEAELEPVPDWPVEPLPELLREPEKRVFWSILVPVGGFLLMGTCYVLGGLNAFSALQQGGILLLAAAILVLAGLRLRRWELGQAPQQTSFAEALDGKRRTSAESQPGETALLAPVRRPLSRPHKLISQNLLRHETLSFDRLPVTLGKLSASCDLVIPQASVSRVHARLELGEEGIYLTDLNSTNGTFQNGIRLQPNRPYLLQRGDEVTLADLKYIYE